MKRILLILILVMLLTITSCGTNSEISFQHNPISQTSAESAITNTDSSIDTTEPFPAQSNNPDLQLNKKPQVFDYEINLNNYDLEGVKKKYLLHVGFDDVNDRPRCLQYLGSYFVDIEEVKQANDYYEIASSSLIPEQFENDLLRISEDGTKLLVLSRESGVDSLQVIDLINKECLYRHDSEDIFYSWVSSSPNMDYLLFWSAGNRFYVDVTKGIERVIHAGQSDLISPDGKRAAGIEYESDNAYLRIYNITTGELIDSICFEEDLFLTQWHSSDKILYYTFKGSFVYDLQTKEIQLIGEYLYEPQMSPDARYVAFYRTGDAGWLFPLYADNYWLYKDYGYREGLYVKDLQTDDMIQINPILYNDDDYFINYYKQFPVCWVYVNKDFANEQYRACTPLDTSDKFRVYSSSIKDCDYFPEKVIDGDIRTAWVEAEEEYNDKEETPDSGKGPYPGEGLGEWVKIANTTAVNFESVFVGKSFDYLKPMKLSGIRLINGYAKSKEIYAANNRVKKAEVILHDGTSFVFDLKDNTMGFQTLDFCREVTTKSITIKILDVYKGNKYNDTCISEVELITD